MDPLEALSAVELPGRRDKLTKALAMMDEDAAQTWLDVIDGKVLDASGEIYSAYHIERAFKHAGFDVSVSSIKRRRQALNEPETR